MPEAPSTKRQKVCFQEKIFSPRVENDRTEIGVEVPLTGGFGDSAENYDRLFQDLAAGYSEDQCNVVSCHFLLIQRLFSIETRNQVYDKSTEIALTISNIMMMTIQGQNYQKMTQQIR